MAKCIRCRQRKARRRCPALGGELCSLCCGRHRHRDIPCPAGCPYLARHVPHQEQRDMENEAGDILNDERLAWLAYHIEHPLKILAEQFAAFSDEDAVQALEYARDKLFQAASLIIVPVSNTLPRHEAGEAVFQSMDRCRFEGRIILSGQEAGYRRDEKLKVLDRLLPVVRSLARKTPGGRNYLQNLQERHRRAEAMSGRAGLVTSD